MKNYFSEEHIMLKKMVEEFSEKEIKPFVQEIDTKSKFPSKIINKMAKLGLLGIPWDEKYGGIGMDTLSLVIAIEEIGKICTSTAVTMMAHTSLGSGPIAYFGTEDQKEKYLTQLAKGEILGAFGLTEPNAGSDAKNTETIAELIEDYYLINGQKAFCTNAGKSGIITITAKIIDDSSNENIGAFIVESDSDGVQFGSPEKKMGWKGSDTRTVFFENVKIPKANILGNPKKGFSQFLETLSGGRITIGGLSLGIAQGAFNAAVKYSKERHAFGKEINKFQGISFKISDMATRIEASKHLVYYAAWLKDNGFPFIKEAAMAKLFSSETAMYVTTEAIQIHGGYGYIKDYNVERYFRDAKLLEIGEGTSEIQRIVISREILNNFNI